MTWIHFVLCSLAKIKVVAWNWYCVCFDNIIAPYYCYLSLQLYFRAIHNSQDRRHSVSFFIYGNGYPGDSIPAVAVQSQQQKQACCQTEWCCWFTVTSNRFSPCIVSFHLMIGLVLVCCLDVRLKLKAAKESRYKLGISHDYKTYFFPFFSSSLIWRTLGYQSLATLKVSWSRI